MSRLTYIYVIAGEGLPFVKIGIAYNTASRVKQLQCGNPMVLYVARRWGPFERPEAERIEDALHSFFDDFRASGEWFCVTPSDVADHVRLIVCGADSEVAAAKSSFFEKVVHG